jgi:hypothetical protein
VSGKAGAALEQALVLSHQLLAAAERSDLQELARLDAERLRLLQSAEPERDSLSAGNRLLLTQVFELNDRAIGLMEHNRRGKGRDLDTAAVGRRAVAAYCATGPER